MTHAEHAAIARARARVFGLHDCIHGAPRAHARADKLYAQATRLCRQNTNLRWYDCAIGLLADGRMALVWGQAGIAEVRT